MDSSRYRDLLHEVAFGTDPSITARDRMEAAKKLEDLERTGDTAVIELAAEVMAMSTEELDEAIIGFMPPPPGEAEFEARVQAEVTRRLAEAEAARSGPPQDAEVPDEPAPTPPRARPTETDSHGAPLPPGISREAADRQWPSSGPMFGGF